RAIQRPFVRQLYSARRHSSETLSCWSAPSRHYGSHRSGDGNGGSQIVEVPSAAGSTKEKRRDLLTIEKQGTQQRVENGLKLNAARTPPIFLPRANKFLTG